MDKWVLKGNKGDFIYRKEVGCSISKSRYTTFETREEAEDFLSIIKSKVKSYGFTATKEKMAIKYLRNLNKVNEDKVEDTPSNKSKRIKFSKEMRKEVYRKSEGKCLLCGKFVDYDDFTVDHIVPLAKGGTNDVSNLQCACKRCNSIKQDILPDELNDVLVELITYNLKKKYNKKMAKSLLKAIFESKFKLR